MTAVGVADEFCRIFLSKILTHARTQGWDLETLATRAGHDVEDLADVIAHPSSLEVSEAIALSAALRIDPCRLLRDTAEEADRPPLRRSPDVDEHLRSLDEQ